MKKSIVLIIAVVYLASIIAIGFFGMQIAAYNEQIYATEIIITNQGMQNSDGEDGIGNYFTVYYDPNGTIDDNVFRLTWQVLPENCTNKKVHFIISEKKKNLVEVRNDGVIILKGTGVVPIEMESETSPKATQSFSLVILKKK